MNKSAFNMGVRVGYQVAGGGMRKQASPPGSDDPYGRESKPKPKPEATGGKSSGGGKGKAVAEAAPKKAPVPSAGRLTQALGRKPGIPEQLGHAALTSEHMPGMIGNPLKRMMLPGRGTAVMKAGRGRLATLGKALIALGATGAVGTGAALGYGAARATEG